MCKQMFDIRWAICLTLFEEQICDIGWWTHDLHFDTSSLNYEYYYHNQYYIKSIILIVIISIILLM